LDESPNLEKWFNKFGILRKVNAFATKDFVIKEIEDIFVLTMEKVCGDFLILERLPASVESNSAL
jgi:hypothetical protein